MARRNDDFVNLTVNYGQRFIVSDWMLTQLGENPVASSRSSAEVRGWNLLKDNLSPEQLSQLMRSGFFEVIGGTSGLRYQIRTGRTFNIDIVGACGQQGANMCFQPKACPHLEGFFCTGDVMLTQKLALELREFDALRAANIDCMDWLVKELARLGHPKSSWRNPEPPLEEMERANTITMRRLLSTLTYNLI